MVEQQFETEEKQKEEIISSIVMLVLEMGSENCIYIHDTGETVSLDMWSEKKENEERDWQYNGKGKRYYRLEALSVNKLKSIYGNILFAMRYE